MVALNMKDKKLKAFRKPMRYFHEFSKKSVLKEDTKNTSYKGRD